MQKGNVRFLPKIGNQFTVTASPLRATDGRSSHHPCQRGNWAEGLTEVSDLAHRADVTDRADNRSCGPGPSGMQEQWTSGLGKTDRRVVLDRWRSGEAAGGRSCQWNVPLVP
jgi:hypothetical protein